MCTVICVIILLLTGSVFWYLSPAAHWLAYIFFGLAGLWVVAEVIAQIVLGIKRAFEPEPTYIPSYHRKPDNKPSVNNDVPLRAVEWQKKQEEKEKREGQ